MASDDEGYRCDVWPNMPDNTEYDGKGLLTLVRAGNSPFKDLFDVNLLIQEVENNVGAKVTDIQQLYREVNRRASNWKCQTGKTSQHVWLEQT
ncbi:uncharacterized protein C8A04DRAFT_30432 [Dichotomopilus funicola]|uniref:Uncharacterized protein n=1 Tax=Dichotomopilus funicola TaxID=1934379 RepID=A0AAN6ZL90_9PEZI|nr:hypothetical protein C8A04DRAFT_30432 [Dichotomopilus funicola]